MKKYLIIIITLISLSSCNKKNSIFPHEDFKDSVSITASKVLDLEDYDVLNTGEVVIYKGWHFFLESKVNQNCLKAISPDFTKTIGAINVGNGPCDVSGITRFFVNNDSLFVFDPNLKKILSVDVVSDSIVVKPYHYFNGRTASLFSISKQSFIKFDLLDSAFFQIVDLDNNVYFKHPYPQDEILSGMDAFSQNTIYGNTHFTISPSYDKIAFSVSSTGMYGFGKIVSPKLVQFDKIINYYSIKIAVLDDKCVVPSNSNIENTMGAASSQDYVFFLYYGIEYQNIFKAIYCRKILVYTWDGKPYKMLCFNDNRNMVDLHYDASRNVLYGISCNPENQYVEIDLNGIL